MISFKKDNEALNMPMSLGQGHIPEPGWTAEAGTGMHQHAPITYPSHHSMA